MGVLFNQVEELLKLLKLLKLYKLLLSQKSLNPKSTSKKKPTRRLSQKSLNSKSTSKKKPTKLVKTLKALKPPLR